MHSERKSKMASHPKASSRRQAERSEASGFAVILQHTKNLIVAGLLIAISFGCRSTQSGNAVSVELAGSDMDAQLNFWHTMADQPVTSNDQAFHGLLLYVDNKDDSTDYTARVEALKSRGMLAKGFNEPAETAVARGTLAVAIVKILQIHGGLTMTILGPSPRYAVRELQFMNLYPPGGTYQTFSGNEFLGIIGRVEDYQRGNPANKPAKDLPNEPASPVEG